MEGKINFLINCVEMRDIEKESILKNFMLSGGFNYCNLLKMYDK